MQSPRKDRHDRHPVSLAENLVHQQQKTGYLVVVDGDEDDALAVHQLLQEFEPRHHHAKPLVVTGQVVGVDGLAQPILHGGRLHRIVVDPGLLARVVGRVDVHALGPARVGRKQGLEGFEVVAVDDQVVVKRGRLGRAGLLHRQELVIFDGRVVIENRGSALELQTRHALSNAHPPGRIPGPRWQGLRRWKKSS